MRRNASLGPRRHQATNYSDTFSNVCLHGDLEIQKRTRESGKCSSPASLNAMKCMMYVEDAHIVGVCEVCMRVRAVFSTYKYTAILVNDWALSTDYQSPTAQRYTRLSRRTWVFKGIFVTLSSRVSVCCVQRTLSPGTCCLLVF